MTIATLLMLAALILFMLAAGGVNAPRLNTGWAGAACAAAALVLVPLLA